MKTLKNTFMITMALLLGYTGLNAQTKLSSEIIQSEKKSNSYIRGNVNFGLPLDISGFTFGEFYNNGNDYFSKTTLGKKITSNFGVQAQAVVGSGLTDRFSVGPNLIIPTPEGIFAKAYIMPAWMNSSGGKVSNKNIAGYFVSANLPFNFAVSSFGEVNLNGKSGAEWAYGEAKIEKKLSDNVSVSYNPALQNTGAGKITPSIEHRVNFTYNF